MKTTRKSYSGEFKAKVVLEALRGDLTLAVNRHGILTLLRGDGRPN